MKKINSLLRKCKSLSRQLGRSTSYSSLRSKSTRGHHETLWGHCNNQMSENNCETIFVGTTRKPYVINSKYMSHPLLNALVEKKSEQKHNGGGDGLVLVRCEVVLFDHLLWMLENSDPSLILDSLEELADLYAL